MKANILIIALIFSYQLQARERVNGTRVGKTPKKVDENSGMSWSSTYKRLYFINDAGGGAYLHLSDLSGKNASRVSIRNATNKDWEDMSYGPCGKKKCLFIGDIGDNDEDRDYHHIYIIKERKKYSEKINYNYKIKYSYADGKTPNAESLAVHPISGDIYIATKNYDGKPTYIYRINQSDYIGSYKSEVKAYRVATIDYKKLKPKTSRKKTFTSAMSISPNGKNFLLVTAQSEQVWQFKIDLNTIDEINTENIRKKFRIIPVQYLGQEEAVEYLSNKSFIYSSEGYKAPIIKYQI